MPEQANLVIHELHGRIAVEDVTAGTWQWARMATDEETVEFLTDAVVKGEVRRA